MKNSTLLSTVKNWYVNQKSFLHVMILILMLSGLITKKAHATHAAGSDLTYQWISGNTYRIEVTFYRDCAGIAEPTDVPVSYKSTALNVNLTVTATKIANTGQEITVPCATSASTCNGGTSVGIRKFVYRATVTLPGAAADWVFSYHVCCRNCAITTIQNPCANSTEIYVESKLNNVLAPGNSSPTFSNIPIAFVCIGQTFNYNHGVLDSNGDSLSYSLITPKISATTNVTYIAPNSTTNPVSSSTPFTLNAVTGQLTFTPNQQQIGILAVLVKEYRNGQLIGSVIRDMQVYTTPCNNNLPTASGINGTSNYSATICPNQQFCFDINTADADASQVVTVTTNNGIANATYTVIPGNRPVIHFCWTPTAADMSLSPHTFTVTVKDNACPNNGIQTYSYNLYVPGPNYTLSSTNVTCNSANNGTATVVPVYGGSFTYNWNTSPVQTTATAVNLAPGTYSVIVTDANSCSLTKSVTITQPSAINTNLSSSNIGCFAACNGAINLSVSGGAGSYSYLWSNGQTVQSPGNICAGTYTVTVTDGTSCSKTASATITQPAAALSTSSSVKSDANCFGNSSGSVDLVLTGGTPPFNYSWSNGATSQDINNLPVGTYTVTITDANNCTKVSSFVISQPSASLAVAASSTQHVSCYNGSNGSITLNVTGGTAPYSYNWSNGATAQNISSLSSGSYTVTVTDANGCIANATQTISQPSGSLSASVSANQNVSCFGGLNGSISLNVIGGTAPYSYSWSNGAVSQNINNLSSGSYTVTITDANSCVATLTQTISQPSGSLSASLSGSQNVFCNGGTNGSISLNVTGGTAPYSYSWSNGATVQNLNGIPAGNYTVTITDANGCTAINSGITVSQPPAALNGNVSSSSNVSCFGGNNGSINLTVIGGTAPYSYSWSNGSVAQDISNLSSGIYTVSITDNNGCTTSISGIAVNQPAGSLNSSVSSSGNVNCFGGNNGSINLTVNGGTAPYSYNWSNGATTQDLNSVPAGSYNVSVTDANGCSSLVNGIVISQPGALLNANVTNSSNVSCFGGNNGSIILNVNGGTAPYSYNWSNGSTSQNLNNVSAGMYSVTITDANGCLFNVNGQTISQPPAALNSSVSSSGNVNCFGGTNGSISLSVNGGTAPYSYSWSNGANTQNISNLSSGIYTVTVTDVNGCTTITSGIAINQPAGALNSTVLTTGNVNCFGGNNGSINLNVVGGTAPYSYSWSNGATTQNLNNVVAGSYNVSVTDVNGCSTSVAGIVISQPGASLNANVLASSAVSCFGGNNGSIILNVNGGTAPYSYNWSNGSTSQNLNNIPAGSYSVTITDANGCLFNINGQTISQPPAALNTSVAATSNVSCFGGNNGSITLNVNGGTAPYVYNWSNGANTQNLANISSGTYTVLVTDANGCTIQSSSIVIGQPASALNGSATTTQNVSCNSGANGTVVLTVTGGTAPYIFNWSTGATTQNINGLYSGTYVVTVTDAQGCIFSASAVVAQPAGALNSTINVSQNVNCFGGSNGSIILNVNGGTAPYTYTWSNGASSQNLSNLSTGTYSVSITDANGCVNVASATVNQPSAVLSGSASSTTNVNCFGGNNGDINLSVGGGTAPYFFQWSNGASTQNISNLAAGTYTVSVTDVNGCTTIVSGIAITQPGAALNGNASSTTNVSCFGGNNGGINLSVNGGTAPYSYQWSNGANTQNITNLAAGTYTVTVTDVNGCVTTVSGIAINEPAAALNGNVSSSTNVNCFGGNNGGITLLVNGGTAPYSYQWSNGASTQNISNLAAGTYTVSVTDVNGCSTIVSGIAINEPAAALSAFIFSQQNVSCNSGATGSVDLTVTDGTAPYTYNWSNGATTEDINNLSSGLYTCTVTDANGCLFTISASIAQPNAALNATVNVTQNVSCNSGANGSVNLTATDGTAPYTYDWSNGETTEDISNLSTGTYTVTVTDANGCVFTISATVTQPAGALNASANVTQNVNCNSGANGTIDLTATDGTAPYTFNWSNGQTTEDISNLTAGTYTVTITDTNGCVFTTSATVTQPAGALNASANISQNVSCYSGANGSIDLTATDGTFPYSYSWSNGSTNEDLNNLSAGTYTVTVTDANGCVFTTSATITQPNAALNATANVSQNVNCYSGANGSIDLTPSDGTSPYSYNWSNGSTTEDLNNLSAGTYTVTVTDANGCTTVVSATVTQPTASLNASANVSQNVSCYSGANGSINLTATDGTSPYSYNWSNGSTTEDLNNLSAGTYTVTVTDANGCTTVVSATVTQPAASLNASANVSQNVSCYSGANGSINLTATDGTSPYSYNWSNGSTTEDLNNLSAGTYTVTVTDANGCTTVVSATVTQPAASLNASANVSQNVSCYSGANGSINLTAADGTAPYSYNWSNGSTTEDLNNLSAGTYTVTVTDANGCTTVVSATVTQPAASLNASANVSQNVSCYSGANGSINLTATNGTSPYSYNWSNGSTTEDLNNLSAGTYTVTVTDANGCVTTASAVVSQPNAALNGSVSTASVVSCYAGSNGSFDLTVTDGTSPYSYNWSNGATTEDLNNLSAGTYTVTVTDANGCLFTTSATITQPSAALNASASVSQNVSCYSGANGSINLTATNGTFPYSYSWSNGATTEDLNNLSTGTYTVTVTDAYGCTATASGIITQPQASLSVSGSGSTSNCLNNIPGDVTISVNGGTAPFTYQWSNGATSQNLNNQSAGIYTVAVTDANGCSTTGSYVITDHSAFQANADGPSEVCMGALVTLVANSVTGATYQWYYNGQVLGGANNNILITPMGGVYFVTVTNACGSFTSDSIVVKVHQVEDISTSPNVIVCPGESTQLYATGGVSYEWTPANSLNYANISNPIASPMQNTQYVVTITNEYGCSTTAAIEVGLCDTLIIPSGYSPDGDVINDAFVIKGIEHYPGNKIWIYNRWGNMVYKAHDYDNKWSGYSNVSGMFIGKRVPAGTYFYVLDLNNHKKPLQGYVVIRY